MNEPTGLNFVEYSVRGQGMSDEQVKKLMTEAIERHFDVHMLRTLLLDELEHYDLAIKLTERGTAEWDV